MERSQKPRLLVLLLALIQVCHGEGSCSSDPGNNITCSSDYNRTISCVWNSTYDHSDSVCTIEALNKEKPTSESSKASCRLKPVEGRSTQMTCNMEFYRDENFQSYDIFSMNLTCNPGPANVTKCFQPAQRIKLNPPQQPHINFTTISWHPQVKERDRINHFKCQLQWKQEKQSWSDPSVQKNTTTYSWRWTQSESAVKLDGNWLIRGKRYEARVRVQSEETNHRSTWSGWSPTASWVSTVGITEQPQPSAWRVAGLFAVAAVIAVFLLIVRFKTDKTTWVYMVKKIKGPPIPNPENSFLKDLKFESRSSPYFLIVSGELDSVEISSCVDAVLPCSEEEALLYKIRSEMTHKSTSSDFSNPNYSHLLPPTPPPPPPPDISSLTAGNLPQCVSDAPYGPVGGQRSEKETDEDRGKKKEEEIHQLFSKGSEAMLLVSDYEKVEELKGERGRLQSLDSGVGSGGEEVSQESMEEESITVEEEKKEKEEREEEKKKKEEVRDEEREKEERREEREKKKEMTKEENTKKEEEREEERVDFHKRFGGEGVIQVCSGYKKLHQVEEEEEETENLLLSPSSSCSSPSLGFSEGLKHDLLERKSLMSSSGSVAPSGDGYIPVDRNRADK